MRERLERLEPLHRLPLRYLEPIIIAIMFVFLIWHYALGQDAVILVPRELRCQTKPLWRWTEDGGKHWKQAEGREPWVDTPCKLD